jgi:uncharacterized protein (TIGR03663 family)
MTRLSARAKKRKQQSRHVAAVYQETPAASEAGLTGKSSTWHWAAGCILVASAVLRLILLDLKPLHHDEGVNGLFLATLFRSGYYHYDPANYHGPTLYYFGWITTTVASFFNGRDGLNTFAIRIVTAIFGIGVVWLVLCLRRQLGDFGALIAAALVAVSPGMVYFSRYFIHEILFVFFTLAVVVAVLNFRESRRPRDLMLASLSASLLGATKETWVITVGVWLVALPCTTLWLRLLDRPQDMPAGTKKVAVQPANMPADPGWSQWQLYGAASLLFLSVWVLFYSSFFTNFPKGVYDSARTFGYWFATGKSSIHSNTPFTYLHWLWTEEAPVLVLGAAGTIVALVRATNRFAVFVAFWGMGILAAYSLVSYKTPWCSVNMVLPLAIVAGYGLGQLYRRLRRLWPLALLAAAVAVAISLYQAAILNFRDYDENNGEKYPYVYAHTVRDFLSMVDEIDSIAAGNPDGKNIGIVVMAPEYWPLPWYLRSYAHATYWGKVINTPEPILIVQENQVQEADHTLGSRYRVISSHDLRPGVRLYLYLRNDVQQ